MKHDYTNDEIRDAWKDSVSLCEFLDALPERPQAAEIAALKAALAESEKQFQSKVDEIALLLDERDKAQPGPWPGQQEAIDAAMIEASKVNGVHYDLFAASPHRWPGHWLDEAPARLAIAQAYDAARPQAAEIVSLKDALLQAQEAAKDLLAQRDKAQGILKACLSVMPFGNIETHTVENLPGRIADLASEIASLSLENERLEAKLAALGQPIAAVVLAQAVRRMEAVPWRELKHINYEAVRARLIAAFKGEGQAMAKNVPGDKCPSCGAEEVESNTPNTTYACGSSDYDGRPGTFHPGDKCEAPPVVVNEPPQDDKQPDLSGESEKQEGAATKKAPATFKSHGYTWTRHTPGDPMPCDGEEVVQCMFADGDLWPGIFPAKDVRWTKNNDLGDVVGWRYADEPAQPWTPAVGDTVRLKSGGPVMTVTHVDPLSLMCAWMNASNELQVEPITTFCLTPAQP